MPTHMESIATTRHEASCRTELETSDNQTALTAILSLGLGVTASIQSLDKVASRELDVVGSAIRRLQDARSYGS